MGFSDWMVETSRYDVELPGFTQNNFQKRRQKDKGDAWDKLSNMIEDEEKKQRFEKNNPKDRSMRDNFE